VWCYVIVVSDGFIKSAKGQAGLGADGVVEAAQRSERATAAETIREIHRAVLAACAGELTDDATAICLSVQ
jgi:Stage II sporulation protein E (SpoIIE)